MTTRERIAAVCGMNKTAPLAACAAALAGVEGVGTARSEGNAASSPRVLKLAKVDAAQPVGAADLAAEQLTLVCGMIETVEQAQEAYLRAVRLPGFIPPQREARKQRVAQAAAALANTWLDAAELCESAAAKLDAAYQSGHYSADTVAAASAVCVGAAVGCRCMLSEYLEKMDAADADGCRARLYAMRESGAAAKLLREMKDGENGL